MVNKDEEALLGIVKAIVDKPDEVRVERQVDEMGVLLRLWVSPQDMALVIGKQGTNAQAIKLIIKLIGVRNGARVNVKIEEPEGSMFRRERQDVQSLPA